MGEDEDEIDQQDETLMLTRLQRNIDDRKRKTQFDQDGTTHVSSDSNQLKSDAQDEENKKAKKKKTKNLEGELEKKRKKQKWSSKQGTSTLEHDHDEDKSVDDSKLENMEISVDSRIRSNPNESQVTGKKEKKSKRREDKSEKKLKKESPKHGLTTEGNNEETLDLSPHSEMDKVAKKREKKLKKEKSVSEDTRESKQNVISQEDQDNPEEMPEEQSEETGFTVIGGQKKDKEVKKVQRVLPDWLAKPIVINADFSSVLLSVEQIPYLDSHIINKLHQHDINHLFPVQSVVIPAILSQMETNSYFGRGGYDPSDICVSAPTGSGKTLAYVLPIIQSLLQRVICHLRALIILPTKDLANQVKQVFEMFAEGTNLRVGLASGSKSFAKDQEQLVGQRFVLILCLIEKFIKHNGSKHANIEDHNVRNLPSVISGISSRKKKSSSVSSKGHTTNRSNMLIFFNPFCLFLFSRGLLVVMVI